MCFCTRLLYLPPWSSSLHLSHHHQPHHSSFFHFIYRLSHHSLIRSYHLYTHSMLQWFLPLAIEMIVSLNKFAPFSVLISFRIDFPVRSFWFARKGVFFFILFYQNNQRNFRWYGRVFTTQHNQINIVLNELKHSWNTSHLSIIQ